MYGPNKSAVVSTFGRRRNTSENKKPPWGKSFSSRRKEQPNPESQHRIKSSRSQKNQRETSRGEVAHTTAKSPLEGEFSHQIIVGQRQKTFLKDWSLVGGVWKSLSMYKGYKNQNLPRLTTSPVHIQTPYYSAFLPFYYTFNILFLLFVSLYVKKVSFDKWVK